MICELNFNGVISFNGNHGLGRKCNRREMGSLNNLKFTAQVKPCARVPNYRAYTYL